MELIEYGYRAFEWRRVVEAGERYSVIPVEDGVSDRAPVKAERGIIVPLRPGEGESLRIEVEYTPPPQAPVEAGEHAGMLRVYLPAVGEDRPIAATRLVVEEGVAKRPPTVWERLIELLWSLWQRFADRSGPPEHAPTRAVPGG